MAGLKFEGDVGDLSNDQSKFIKEVFAKHGFTDTAISVSPVGKIGDNYVATVLRMSAENNEKTLKVIAKVAPKNEIVRQMMSAAILFRNESFMYNEVFPKFEEIQKNAGISEKERFRFPACYGTLSTAPNEIILLEDLKQEEFITLDRLESMPEEYLKLALKSVAQFHSLSFALKIKDPDVFFDISNNLINFWALINDFEEAKISFQLLEKDVISLFEGGKYKKIFEGTVGEIADLAVTAQIKESDLKYTVIQQGDCWCNNIMFKVKDGKVIENVLIDYQLSKSTSPADDILYLILNCTDYEIRSKEYYHWIDYYHSELEQYLAKFNLEVDAIYSREQLNHDLKSHARLNLALSVLLSSVLVRQGAEVFDFKTQEHPEDWQVDPEKMMEANRIVNAKRETLDRFKKKVKGTVDSMLEWGYLE